MNLIDPKSRPVLAPGVRRQNDRKTGEPILVFPEGVMLLNATANEIINLCNGELTVSEVIARLANEYGVGQETLTGDVLDSLLELNRRKLLRLLK